MNYSRERGRERERGVRGGSLTESTKARAPAANCDSVSQSHWRQQLTDYLDHQQLKCRRVDTVVRNIWLSTTIWPSTNRLVNFLNWRSVQIFVIRRIALQLQTQQQWERRVGEVESEDATLSKPAGRVSVPSELLWMKAPAKWLHGHGYGQH